MIVKNSFFAAKISYQIVAGKSAYSGYLQGMGLKSTKTKGTKLKLTYDKRIKKANLTGLIVARW